MRNCNNNRTCGDITPQKWLTKVAMGCAYSMLLALLCVACSREEELYQAPYADSNEKKVGRQETERVEPADQHDGRYSLYLYEFEGKGPAHTVADIKKYGLDDMGSRGSEVSVKVRIEWPDEKAGLSADALAKVRKTILWMAFAHTPEISPYSVPESLGETEESLRKRDKELWKEYEGEDRDLDEYGLQPADWALLAGDALSHETGRLPAKDDGRVTTKTIELGMAGIKEHAQSCYKCAPPEKMNDSWWHCCSQWTFAVDLHLEWPFGLSPKEEAEWYERPVLCVWNDGYDRDGGNGCHESYISKVFSLPDGRELGIEDYFAADKLKALTAFVTKRFLAEHSDSVEASEEEIEEALKDDECLLDLADDEVSMLVNKEGIKWTWAPYSILPGCDGAPSIFIKWQDLRKFKVEK